MVDTLLGIQVFPLPVLFNHVGYTKVYGITDLTLSNILSLKQYSKTAMNKQVGTDLSQLVRSRRVPGLNP